MAVIAIHYRGKGMRMVTTTVSFALAAAVVILTIANLAHGFIASSPVASLVNIAQSKKMAQLTAAAAQAGLSDVSKGGDEVIRDYEPIEGVKWRYGDPPNYEVVNKAYFDGRTFKFAQDSLEAIVQKAVKNWEVESHHIEDPAHWKTMKVDEFKAYNNELKCPYTAAKMAKEGPYNMLLGDLSSDTYMGSQETYDTANENFKATFPKGFPWEILEVFSGPPNISCTFRHWAEHAGPYRAADGTMYKATGKTVELFGQLIARVTADLQITELQVFYDRELFIRELMSGGPVE